MIYGTFHLLYIKSQSENLPNYQPVHTFMVHISENLLRVLTVSHWYNYKERILYLIADADISTIL